MASVYGEGSWSKKTIKGVEYWRYQGYIGRKRKDFYGRTKTEALKKYKCAINDAPSNYSPYTITLSQVAEEMLEDRKSMLKPTSYDGYRFEIAYLSKQKIGKEQIHSITTKKIQAYIDSLADKKAYSSIKKHKILLNLTFEYALDNGYVSTHIMRKVHLPNQANVKKETRQPVFLTTEERHRLEKVISNTSKNEQAIKFILHTGLRISELIALRWDDVDFESERLHISKNAPESRNYGSEDTKYSAKITTPKRKSSIRTIPLDATAMDILNNLYKQNTEGYAAVFVNSNGNLLLRRNVGRSLVSVIKRAKLEKNPSLHDLRHTYASELIRNGVDIKKVSMILGHSDVSTTLNIYVHNSDEDLDSVKSAID